MKRCISSFGITSTVVLSADKAQPQEEKHHLRLRPGWHRYWQLGIAVTLGICGVLVTPENRAFAQITPDASLGVESSIVTPNATVKGQTAEQIDGGALRGANLFHSFSEFNVRDGQRVYFANPTGVENILSRVTGLNPSNIFGTLGVNGAANLFLLNPNGIIFGANVRLDIPGSFVASTANSLVFDNNFEFSATNPQVPPILTVNVPLGLQYGSNQSAARITNTGNLAVGQNLTLSADNLDLQGQLSAGGKLTLQGTNTVQIRDSATNPFIASAGGQLTVQGNQTVDIFALNHPDSGLFSGGDMVLRSANTVGGDAHYTTGGNFRIEQLDGSLGNLYSPYDPVIRANGDVSFNSHTGASLHIFAGGSVIIPGFVWIQGADPVNGIVENVTLSDGTVIAIDGRTEPTLDIRAGTTAIGTPLTAIGTPTSADIAIGTVLFGQATINPETGLPFPLAGKVLLTNQYQPNPSLTGDILVTTTQVAQLTNRAILNGDFSRGGSVTIDSRGEITLNGIVNTDALQFGGTYLGNGGDVTLFAQDDITLTPGSLVNSSGLLGGRIILNSGGLISSAGNGDDIPDGIYSISNGIIPGSKGGNIEITADSLLAEDGAIFTTSTVGQVNAGDIKIQLNNTADFLNGSQLRTDTFGAGNAGEIQLRAGGAITFESSSAGSAVNVNQQQALVAARQGGNITVTADSLTLDNGSTLFSNIFGQGDAGDIFIQTNDFISLTNRSQIRGGIEPGGIGQAADIEIRTGSLEATGGSQIGSFLFRQREDQLGNIIAPGAQGRGGKMTVIATESVFLSGINSDGFSSGLISLTERGAFGPAGDIFVDVSEGNFRVEKGATVAASTRNPGDGGNITILAKTFEALDGGRVQANSDSSGRGGIIDINATERITVSGVDANFAERLNLIDEYLKTPDGEGDQIDDVLGGIGVSYSGLYANTRGTGIPGAIKLTSPVVDVFDAAVVVTDAYGGANGGDIAIKAQDFAVFSGGNVVARTFGAGRGGNITVDPLNPAELSSVILAGVAQFPLLEDGITVGGYSSGLAVNSEDGATGQGGTLRVNTDILQIADGAVLSARTRESGRGGDITLNVNTLDITGGGQIITPTFGSGRAGDIRVNATGDVFISGFDPTFDTRFDQVKQALIDQALLNGIILTEEEALRQTRFVIDPVNSTSGLQSTVEREATADPSNLDIGGSIRIRANSLFMTEGGVIAAGTAGFGNAGDISVRVDDAVAMADGSTIRGTVEQRGIGNGGDVEVTGRSLTLISGAQIQAGVFREEVDSFGNLIPGGIGNAGDIQVNFTDFINLDGVGTAGLSSGLYVSTEQGAIGSAGDLTINTNAFRVGNGAVVNAETRNASAAGNITINANTFEASNNGRVLAISRSSGPGGNVYLDIEQELFVQGDATVAVSGFGTGNPGNLSVRAGSILLSQGGSLQALTTSGENANIIIRVENSIDMFSNSEISTEALGTGRGGNMALVAGQFIRTSLAENSDIVANAYAGQGGNIVATAEGIFGFRKFEDRRTPESDFTASSELSLDGTTRLNTRDRLQQPLPINLVDPVGLIDRSCTASAGERSSFTSIGRGGVQPNPADNLENDAVVSTWVDSDEREPGGEGERGRGGENQPDVPNPQSSIPSHQSPIMEAQGWVVNEQGKVVLTAQASTVTPQGEWHSSAECQASK